jgi:hypothetical protein
MVTQHSFQDQNIENWVQNVLSKLITIDIFTIDTLIDTVESQSLVVSLHQMMRYHLHSLLKALTLSASPAPFHLFSLLRMFSCIKLLMSYSAL